MVLYVREEVSAEDIAVVVEGRNVEGFLVTVLREETGEVVTAGDTMVDAIIVSLIPSGAFG